MLSREHLNKRLEDKEFRAAYEALEHQFILARALLFYREETGMTRKELAKVIGIRPRYLSKLESAMVIPTEKIMMKIKAALKNNIEV
jgi:ribosome-binding protein aMBF1 (putative translation factor)